MSKRILVTGVTGSGKSTLEKIFNQKGYETSDIDKGFAEWRNKETGEVEPHPESADRLAAAFWALRADELKERLSSIDGQPILIFGSTNDLDDYTNLFNTIFLLEYPDAETLRARLASRPEGDYGKVPHERDSALAYHQDYQNKMKELGAIAIDCMLPLEQIVSIIEAEVKDE